VDWTIVARGQRGEWWRRAAYDPARKRWIDLPKAPVANVEMPTDVWTGTSFIVWGQGQPSNLGEELVAKG
jgi:hypothetical protein